MNAAREPVIAALTADGPFALTDAHEGGAGMKRFANAPPSLRDVLLMSRAFGPRPFLVYEAETLTFGQHFDQAAGLARTLRAMGVRKGDRVAIGMRNYPEWSVSFWACQAIGAIAVSLNAWWTGAELAYAIHDSGPSVLLIDGERLERMRPLIDRGLAAIVTRREGCGGLNFAQAVAGGGTLPEMEVGPDDLATILYTSGTTGQPKGAMATHGNHVTNILSSLLTQAITRRVAGVPDPDPQGPQLAALQTFPFFHIGGMTGLCIGLATGSKLVLMHKWDPHAALALVQAHQINAVSGVPMVVRQLLEAAEAVSADLSSLVSVSSGGAAMPPETVGRMRAQRQGVTPGNGFGLTETTGPVIVNMGDDYVRHPDSIGRPTPVAQVRLVGDDGRDVAPGEIGEIWVRGANVIPGYWRNSAATAAEFGDGWFRTGDLGRCDAEGLYYLVDRKKDVIIRGGENVYSVEVEAAIQEDLEIREAAVLGVPHAVYGEEVVAVLQVAPNVDPATLLARLNAGLGQRLARFKIPSRFHVTAEDLPRTATGKVVKRELIAHFLDREPT